MSAGTFFRLLLGVNGRILFRRAAAVREQSRLMVAVIALFVVGYFVAGYEVFRWGFLYLAKFPFPGLGAILLDRMLYLFFAFLFVMLIFSNMIIGYSTLFKSYETEWMLTLPVRHTDVYRWKLAETTLLASWAFLFLSAPLMLAYGSVRQVTGWFYVKAFLLFVPFTIIPAAVGSLLVLLVTRYLHRRMFKWALFGLGVLLVAAAVLFLKPMEPEKLQRAEMVTALNQLLHNSRITVQPMLPSYWVASSMIAWGEGWAWKGTFFFLVLVSNAMMAGLVCVAASGRLFYDGWSRNRSQGSLRFGVALLDKEISLRGSGFLERALGLWPRMRPATRALVVKDIRVFWRDTSQWSQFVIFFGLLGLYVLNLRNVQYDWTNAHWANFVAFLNLGASSMTLATLTTRFVFPQFSLEGKRLWIVGMVPGGLRLVLLEKFWLSSVCCTLITLTLSLLSSWMLRIPVFLAVLFGSTVVLMSFALCGIAVGIGALFPNFGAGSTANRQDDNPAKIVSGFGGTFCFVLSLVFIVLVIGAEAWPMFASFARGGFADESRLLSSLVSWVFVSALSLLAACVPMSLALKRVESLEM
jgi:ABC-2 type transport system permease protein